MVEPEENLMEDQRRKPLIGSVVLQSVIGVLLCVPLGLSVGTLLSLLDEFGLRNTVETIRLNPEVFTNQYAGPLVYHGWIALVCLVAAAAIVSVQLWRRKKG